MRNSFILAAGVLYLLTALAHTIEGQFAMIDPLMESTLDSELKSQWLVVWYLITGLLWCVGLLLTSIGLKYHPKSEGIVFVIGAISFVFSLVFIGSSLWTGHHATQYIFLLAISSAIFFGLKKAKMLSVATPLNSTRDISVNIENVNV